MIFNLFVAHCFMKSWLAKITQMKLFYQKYLSVKVSPAKAPLNTLSKAFNPVYIQGGKASKLIVDPEYYPQCGPCKGIDKIKINKRMKTIESDLVVKKKVKTSTQTHFNISFETKKKSLFVFIIFFVIVKKPLLFSSTLGAITK